MATRTIEIPFSVDPADVATRQNRMVGCIDIEQACTLQTIEFVGHDPADGAFAWLCMLAPSQGDVSDPGVTAIDANPSTGALAAFGDALPSVIQYPATYAQVWPSFGAVGAVGYLRGLSAGQSIAVKIELAPCAEAGARVMRFTFEA